MSTFSPLELLAAYAISFALGVASMICLRSYADHLRTGSIGNTRST